MGDVQQNIYGLFIGVNRYESEDIRPLAFASADVLAVRDKLAERFGLRYENTVVLADDVRDGFTPTRRQILRAMNRFAAAPMQETDLFMFVFAGHGFSCAGRTFLAACDSEIASEALLRETAVSLETVRDFLGQIPAGQQALILDACRDAPIKGTRSIGSQTMSGDMTRDIGTVIRPTHSSGAKGFRASAILCSCWEGQVAHEYTKGGHGWFCHNLLEELSQATDRDLSLSELHGRIKDRMQQSAWRLLPAACDQAPHLLIDGDIPALRLSAATAGTEVSTSPPPTAPVVEAVREHSALTEPSQQFGPLPAPSRDQRDRVTGTRAALNAGISVLLQGGPATAPLREVCRLSPEFPEANLALGIALLSSGLIGSLSYAQVQEAEGSLRVALADPDTKAAAAHALAALRHCFYMDHSGKQPAPDFHALKLLYSESEPPPDVQRQMLARLGVCDDFELDWILTS